jgi:hypothetical protein
MLENKKKRKGTSLVTLNKVITKVSLLQEGDADETISKTIKNNGKPTTKVNKLVATSSVVSKIIEEGKNLRDVDT